MAESIPEKDQFLTAYPNYVLRETVTYPNGGVSHFYDDGVDMVIIDDEICSCRDGEQIFPYNIYMRHIIKQKLLKGDCYGIKRFEYKN